MCVAVADQGLGLDAVFVAGIVGVVGHALVGEHAQIAVLAQPKNLAPLAERARGGVVERVVLKSSAGFEVKAECGKP